MIIVNFYLFLVNKVAKFLVRLGISPMLITFIGLLLSISAGILFWIGHLFTGGLVLFLGGVMDNLDGAVARAGGKATKYGALFDSTLDRYGEFFNFVGLYGYLGHNPDIFLAEVHQMLVLFALIGSVMVSYVRARSEALGIASKAGFFQRPQRVVAIGLCAMLTGLTNPLFDSIDYHNLHDFFLRLLVLVLAIGTNFTAVRRLLDARKIAEKP
jgi:CDP-diacylglycerol--glycerol-3-phosphate 3-phosphatidyltransferase